jgi:hypothetical protein
MRSPLYLSLVLSSLLACGGDDTAVDGGADSGPRVDGGGVSDGGAGTDGGGVDGATADGGGVDGGEPTPDGGALDGGLDGGEPDAGSFDGGPATPCATAGGTCVAVVPSACRDGIVGNADWYSCGGGLGVMCCLPTSTPPLCRAVGTRSEGWYAPDGRRICYASCDGHTATCEAIGTRSEGWYTDAASAACSAIPVDRLIEWTMCAP